jgi:hypothetical protein
MSEFLQAQLESRFHCPERRMRGSGNLPVTQSLEKSQLDRLALKLWQRTDVFLQEMAKII